MESEEDSKASPTPSLHPSAEPPSSRQRAGWWRSRPGAATRAAGASGMSVGVDPGLRGCLDPRKDRTYPWKISIWLRIFVIFPCWF